MNAAPPLVSVVICTRNRRALLAETVASVRAQTGVAWELLVVDDASTDDTWDFLQTLDSDAIRCLRQTQHGERSAARNRGLAEARAQFVMFLDDDDLLVPDALKNLSGPLLRRSGPVAAVGARWDWFCDGRGGGRRDSHVRVRREREVFFDLLFGWSAVSGQNLFRVETVRRAGGYDLALNFCEDRDLWLRVARLGPVALLPAVVMKYRVHPGQWRPDNLQGIREKVFRRAIRALPARERRHGLLVRHSARRVQQAEDFFSTGNFFAGFSTALRAWAAAPGLFLSPLVGPWVARRLARRVWHRLRGH
ncbi:MAG: glycosyltransferase [Verrucomicrobia bacterium]|nr:glycosyltransferase [Verrucomicrobiota bacterium]